RVISVTAVCLSERKMIGGSTDE
ncbi:MAG: hypothetical protein QOH82_3585, partial [Mycobacterium sp.]|nr:hypothetical protein [Mycobacterium sp.]